MANKYTGKMHRTPEMYVEKFRLLASQIGPNFKYTEAVKAGVWTSHIGESLDITYNQMRGLSGLPLLRVGRHLGQQGKKKTEYLPRVQSYKRAKGPLVNPCLGQSIDGIDCTKKLPKGQHFCPRCKIRKDGIS